MPPAKRATVQSDHQVSGSTVSTTTLACGLRVVTEANPAVRSAAVGLWVAVGSRDETPAQAGAAHFLEHLLFKRTPTRTAESIANEIDGRGGELNAFTTKEHTCFYAHVLDEDLAEAIDLVSDVVLNGKTRASDVAVEREVVLEEIAMQRDDPEDVAAELIHAAAFAGHPLALPVIGTEESIRAMTGARLGAFHRRHYTPERMVLAASGNVEHAAVVSAARKAFRGRPRVKRPAVPAPSASPITGSQLLTDKRDADQAHLFIGYRTGGRSASVADRWALAALNSAIGGGLSSRLFTEIRERRGLAYSTYSSVDAYADAGMLSVYIGATPDRVEESVALADSILTTVAAEGITEEELDRAKASLRAGTVMGLEDTQSRMHRIGRTELYGRKHHSVDDTLTAINAITLEQVAAAAADLLTAGGAPAERAVAAVGNTKALRAVKRAFG